MADSRPTIQATIDTFRNQINDLDNAAISQLITSYATTRRRLIQRTNELAKIVIAQGDKATPTQILKLAQVKRLLDTIDEELRQYGIEAEVAIKLSQAAALGQAEDIAAAIALAQKSDLIWTRVDPRVIVAMLGRLQDGSPLKDLLGNLAPSFRDVIERELIDAITTGTNVRAVGKRLANASTIPLSKATQIATDAVLGSYRSANFASLAANQDILRGWAWAGALQSRTCSYCLSQIGREFPITVTFMAAHSRCRCQPIPLTKDYVLDMQTGEDWLKGQPIATQQTVLGKKAGSLFASGALQLPDFTVITNDSRWGPSGSQGSIEDALANSKRRG